ncbi:killer cell lectin-like receptor subfamily B member 1B allele C [Apteryx mantelli]|uniref:Killer cell lectin-like receptor subfamily B member 1B allele C n=1 Tax=Apteryx mantelli TaxID=2696672 RepID=A0ABM4FXR9_9AVES
MLVDFRDAVARDRQHLRESLCPPQGQDPAEGDGCRLCPPGWTQRGRKCYWVANGAQSWDKSRENCTSRDAELLMPEDCDELEFVKDIAKKPSKYFWIDISGPDRSQIRLSGSCLDQSGAATRILSRSRRLPLGSSKGCRALKGNRILTETCGSMISWICQKAAVAL